MADQPDSVWEHGENVYPGFCCKYYKSVKRGVVPRDSSNIWHIGAAMWWVVLTFLPRCGTISVGSLIGPSSGGRTELDRP